MRISLIIPTLNERGSIYELLARIDAVAKQLSAQNHQIEAIVVDDASFDGTVAMVSSARERVSYPIIIIERAVRDLSGAVLAGLAVVKGEAIGVMDADLSHPPELLPKLVDALRSADLVVASRHLPGGGVENWPWLRQMSSVVGTTLARWLEVTISDPMSGFFLMKREVVAGITLSPIGYKILLEILIKGRYNQVAEVSYVFANRTVGHSKLSPKIIARYLVHILRLHTWRKKHK